MVELAEQSLQCLLYIVSSFFPLSVVTHKRYVPQNIPDISTSVPPSQVATFATSYFSGVKYIFLKHWPIKENKAILKTSVGYTGGDPHVANPTYRQVCSRNANHADALCILFDPTKVTYHELVGSLANLCSLEMPLFL